MRRFWNFIRDYWHLPLLIAVLILGAIVVRRRGGKPAGQLVAEEVQNELAVINAGADARRARAELGAAKAREQVLQTYEAQRAALDEEQHQQARELADDPEALARFLVRAGQARR